MNRQAREDNLKQQNERFQQTLRAAEDRQAEEHHRNEERARAEQEQRRREEDGQREAQRRNDTGRRQDDERRRSEQYIIENSRRHEPNTREQISTAKTQTHAPETRYKTMAEWNAAIENEKQKTQIVKNSQTQSAGGNGVASTPKLDQVDIAYNYTMNMLKNYLATIENIPVTSISANKPYKTIEEWKAEIQKERAVASQGGVQNKESPAMEKYRAHEQTLSNSVQAHIASQRQEQSMNMGQERWICL